MLYKIHSRKEIPRSCAMLIHGYSSTPQFFCWTFLEVPPQFGIPPSAWLKPICLWDAWLLVNKNQKGQRHKTSRKWKLISLHLRSFGPSHVKVACDIGGLGPRESDFRGAISKDKHGAKAPKVQEGPAWFFVHLFLQFFSLLCYLLIIKAKVLTVLVFHLRVLLAPVPCPELQVLVQRSPNSRPKKMKNHLGVFTPCRSCTHFRATGGQAADLGPSMHSNSRWTERSHELSCMSLDNWMFLVLFMREECKLQQRWQAANVHRPDQAFWAVKMAKMRSQ